jgi:Ammonium Transporter Family
MRCASALARPTATRCKNFFLSGRQHRFKYDDSLDVFGVHGIGGMVGTLLAGIFAVSAIGGTAGLIEGHPQQLPIQATTSSSPWSGRAASSSCCSSWSACWCRCGCRCGKSWKASTFRSTARRCSNSLSKYRIPAAPLSRIMSRVCRADRLGKPAYVLSATEWRRSRGFPQSAKRAAFIIR